MLHSQSRNHLLVVGMKMLKLLGDSWRLVWCRYLNIESVRHWSDFVISGYRFLLLDIFRHQTFICRLVQYTHGSWPVIILSRRKYNEGSLWHRLILENCFWFSFSPPPGERKITKYDSASVQIPTTRQHHYIIHKDSFGDSQNVIAAFDDIFGTEHNIY